LAVIQKSRSLSLGARNPTFNSDDLAATIPSVFPALIKPNYGDSSIGITKDAVVHTWEEAITRLGRLREQMPGCPILIQEF
jgi:D-alanine-D-alanine ligase